MNKLLKIITGFSAFIAVLVVCVYLFSGNGQTKSVDLSYSWNQDQAWRYSLVYNVEGKGAVFVGIDSKNSVTKNNKNIDVRLRADLVLSNSESNGSGIILNATLTGTEFSATLGNQADVIPPLDQPLNFQVSMRNNGSVEKLIMSDEDYHKHGDLLRDIFSLIEFPLDSERKSTWTSKEQHMINSYPVVFDIIRKDLFSNIWQVEKRYERIEQADISGPIVYRFDNELGLVNQVEGTRQRQFKLAGEPVSGDTTHVSLKFEGFLDRPTNQAISKVNKDNLTEDTLTGEVKRQQMRERSKRTVLGDNDVHSIKDSLDSVDLTNDNEITKLSRQVVALLELYPELTGDISRWLLEYDVHDERFGAVSSAFTYVGSDVAQEALINILGQLDVGEAKHVSLMANLAFVKKPNVANEEYFYDLLEYSDNKSVYSKANLALGVIANNLGGQDIDRKKKIFNLMQDKLALSKSSMEDRPYINAIGNIGVPEQVPVLQDYIENQDNDLAVRKEAVVALRFVGNKEAENLLIDYLVDENEGIRTAAAEALTYTGGSYELLSVYAEQLGTERNISVIKQMLKHISSISSEYPEGVDMMDQFISQCGLKTLCDYASQLRKKMT